MSGYNPATDRPNIQEFWRDLFRRLEHDVQTILPLPTYIDPQDNEWGMAWSKAGVCNADSLVDYVNNPTTSYYQPVLGNNRE